MLVIDGIGIWLAARRLHQGHFAWPAAGAAGQASASRAQLEVLALGLPCARMGQAGVNHAHLKRPPVHANAEYRNQGKAIQAVSVILDCVGSPCKPVRARRMMSIQ